MAEPLTPTEGDDDEWITRPKADGIAVTLTRRQWRERDEGQVPEGARQGRDWQTY
jgi:hypothetical protein